MKKLFLYMFIAAFTVNAMPPKKGDHKPAVYSSATWLRQKDNASIRRQNRLRQDPFFQEEAKSKVGKGHLRGSTIELSITELPQFALSDLSENGSTNPYSIVSPRGTGTMRYHQPTINRHHKKDGPR